MLSDVKPAKHKSGCFPTLWTWELCSCSFLLYAALAKIYRQVMKRFRKGVSSALSESPKFGMVVPIKRLLCVMWETILPEDWLRKGGFLSLVFLKIVLPIYLIIFI